MVTIVTQLTMVTVITRICTVGARLMEVRVAEVVGVVIHLPDRQAMASATTMAVATTSSSRLKITTNRT